MARVTVEDCIERVPNRFALVILASHRARAISAGGAPLVDRDNDKDPVVALREIADRAVGVDDLRDSFITSLQEVKPTADADEKADLLALQAPVAVTEDQVLAALQAEQQAQREDRF